MPFKTCMAADGAPKGDGFPPHALRTRGCARAGCRSMIVCLFQTWNEMLCAVYENYLKYISKIIFKILLEGVNAFKICEL